MAHPVIRRTESHFAGARGQSLLRRTWAPPELRSVLVLTHGFAEHTGRYERLAAWLAERGCAVFAHDQQGHGRSDGARNYVRRFDDFLDDLEIALRDARAAHPGVPLFLLGHSMGGLVTAAFARERKPDVAGVALSAPALALGDGVSRARIAMARILRRVAPRLVVSRDLDPEALSRDAEVQRAYVDDPLVDTRMTASLAAELVDAVRRTAAGAADVMVPLLILHGEADPLCPVEGSRAFCAGATQAKARIITYPDLRHEIFNEPEQETVFGDLLEWVRGVEAQA